MRIATRDGRFEVVSSAWGSNGSFTVRVVDHHTADTGTFVAAADSPVPEAARRTARRVDPMRKVKRSHFVGKYVVSTESGNALAYDFVVSRNN